MVARGISVGALARRAGLSRSALLYYDRLGLLRPRGRSAGNYRLYSPAEVERLERICAHRSMGIPLKQIADLLDHTGDKPAAEILQRRLEALGSEIHALRQQQRAIARILQQEQIHEEPEMIKKERWVEIMRAAGFTEKDMHNWHIQFEKMEPDAHQEFLESLGIDPGDIARIREWSRQQG
jgi:MerR family transcriptional regulator, thiopeptide resistance regulator